MEPKKLLCRADGNSTSGLGHLYRMLAVAEFYKESFEINFITSELSALSVISNEYHKILIPKNISISEEPDWLSMKFSPTAYILISDGYQFVTAYQKRIKKLGYTYIYIDDLTTEHMYADVVVNHSPHCKPNDFSSEKHTVFALGTKYAMLRPKFNEAAKKKRIINKIENAFVCFGGADKYDLSLLVAKALLNIDNLKNINVVLGLAYKHQEIFELEQNNSKLNLYSNLDESALIGLMHKCQIAIVPSSTILFEVCSVKMPVLSGFYADNQKFIYNEFAKQKVIIEGGNFANYTITDFRDKVKIILQKTVIMSFLQKQQELFDGKSKMRFLALINRLTLSFRKAKINDISLVFDWSNDPLVRQNSFQSTPIEFSDHHNWFLNKIANDSTLFLIAMINNEPAGIVRYEIEDKHTSVSILVSRKFRGRKLASSFLIKSTEDYFNVSSLPVLAYIKVDNISSVKAFENAGYKFYKKKEIEGTSSFIYKLQKYDAFE